MMRSDLAAWGLAAGLALAAGLIDALRAMRGADRRPAALAWLPWLALAAVLAGLAWRWRLLDTPPGARPADSLALLAIGTLCGAAWLWPGGRRPDQPKTVNAELDEDGTAATLRAAAGQAGAWIVAGLLLIAALALGWVDARLELASQAYSWMFVARSVLAGLGFGGWPVMVCALAISGVQGWRAAGAMRSAVDPGAGARRSWASAGEATLPVLRFSYPCLTAALLAGVAWDLAAYAIPWRGTSAEFWLAAGWSLAGAYLATVTIGKRPRLTFWLLSVLAAAGLAAALLAAWQAPGLYA